MNDGTISRRVQRQKLNEPDRFFAEIETHQIRSAMGAVALVEHEIEHVKNRFQAFGHLMSGGHFQNDEFIAQSSLCAHEPLGDRRVVR